MKCDDCQADWPESESVHLARDLMAKVNHHGNLHVYVDDGNLEDYWFQPSEEYGGLPSARKDVMDNQAGASADDSMVEIRLVTLLESMSEDDRWLAYEACPACMRGENERLYRWYEMVEIINSAGLPMKWSGDVEPDSLLGLDARAAGKPFGVVTRALPGGIIFTGDE